MIKIGELLRKLWSLRSCFLILPPRALTPQGIEDAMPFEDFVLKFQHICRMMVDLGLVYWWWFDWEFLLHDLIYACLGWTGWSDWLRNGRLMPGSWDSPPILSDHILCNLIICTSSQLNLFGLSITLRTSRGCLWSLFKSIEHPMWQMISFTIHLAQVSV